MRSIEELNNTCGAIAQSAVQLDSADLRSKQELIEEKYEYDKLLHLSIPLYTRTIFIVHITY